MPNAAATSNATNQVSLTSLQHLMFDPTTNPQIDEYDVIEKIGEGGQAIVFRARHRLMNRDVALKVLRPEFAENDQMRRMFRIEIKVSAMLTHPQILRAYDAREFNGVPYLVLELCQGKALNEEVVALRQLAIGDAISYVRQAAEGLAYAHDHSVVHRDVKPSNLFLTNDKGVLVFDWGLARLHGAAPTYGESPFNNAPKARRPVRDESLRQVLRIWRDASGPAETQIRTFPGVEKDPMTLSWTGHVVGTPAFMAPEQSRSSDVDLRADIYSLGATLYTLLVGSTMFAGDIHQVVRSVTSQEPPAILDYRDDVSSDLQAIYYRMVAKKPEDRYQSMSEVIQALEHLGTHPKIFISYRREDSLDATDRMYEVLCEQFGSDNVFMDVDTILPGTDFRYELNLAVAQAGIVLVVIGDHWLTGSSTRSGVITRRLDNPNDFVRIEIEAALNRKIRLVPVLVAQAQMPFVHELPDSLRELAFQQAAELRPGRQYQNQIKGLIEIIKRYFNK